MEPASHGRCGVYKCLEWLSGSTCSSLHLEVEQLLMRSCYSGGLVDSILAVLPWGSLARNIGRMTRMRQGSQRERCGEKAGDKRILTRHKLRQDCESGGMCRLSRRTSDARRGGLVWGGSAVAHATLRQPQTPRTRGVSSRPAGDLRLKRPAYHDFRLGGFRSCWHASQGEPRRGSWLLSEESLSRASAGFLADQDQDCCFLLFPRRVEFHDV
jgi:hypothetical protein